MFKKHLILNKKRFIFLFQVKELRLWEDLEVVNLQFSIVYLVYIL